MALFLFTPLYGHYGAFLLRKNSTSFYPFIWMHASSHMESDIHFSYLVGVRFLFCNKMHPILLQKVFDSSFGEIYIHHPLQPDKLFFLFSP